MDSTLISALAASAVAMAVPLLLAALGELIAERAGIINIGLEGMMLAGAFAAMAATYSTGSVILGILLALFTGAALGGLFAWIVVARNANQIVAGAALNLLAIGLTGVLYRAIFGVTGAALTIAGTPIIPLPFLQKLPLIGPGLFRQTALGYIAFLLVPAVSIGLYRTLPGLTLRLTGENPHAAERQGVSVYRVRTLALVACGILAAAAGAHLAVGYAKTFVEGMSAGRGFIALAIVILGRRSAWGVMIAALFFGLATALQFHFQALSLDVPFQLFLALPYLLTLVVLAASGASAAAPAALGQPYERT